MADLEYAENQKHRLLSPDGDIVLEIDRRQCVTFSSLRRSNLKMSLELATLEDRFDLLTVAYIEMSQMAERYERDNETLRWKAEAAQEQRNRSANWQG